MNLLSITPLLALLTFSMSSAGSSSCSGGSLEPAVSPANTTPHTAGWRTDDTWYDGKAEKAIYRGTRSIYGLPRHFVATAYTNKQIMDPKTTVKATGNGVETFKHHWSELVPTENYDYDYSTASFLNTKDMSLFKLALSTQEDCGATFKQVVNSGRQLEWWESVYHPGGGLRTGKLKTDVVPEDCLTMALRNFTWGSKKTSTTWKFTMLPSQKSPKRVSYETVRAEVEWLGTAELDLPTGSTLAHHLVLKADGRRHADYWFAADGSAPMLHALVKYEGPSGVSYELESLERTAYWER